MIEVLNNKTINEAGAKYKIETRKIQKELDEWDKNRPEGFTETDEIIADAIEDPTFKLDQIIARYKLDPESDEEEEQKVNKLVKKNEMISIKDRANKKITDKKILDFEKVQHMRVKMLNEGPEEPEGFDGYLLMKDLDAFRDKIKTDFHDTKVKFRSVYNDLRTKEHRVFANLEMERGQERNEKPGAAYAKIEVEKAMIKERLARAGATGKALDMSEDSEEPSEEE